MAAENVKGLPTAAEQKKIDEERAKARIEFEAAIAIKK